MVAQLKVVVLGVAAAALLTPALASGGNRLYHSNAFRLELDPSPSPAGELVFTVVQASNWGRRYEGHKLTLEVDEASRIRVPDRDDDGEAELSDLRPHDRIHVVALVSEDEDRQAARITVRTLHITHPD